MVLITELGSWEKSVPRGHSQHSFPLIALLQQYTQACPDPPSHLRCADEMVTRALKPMHRLLRACILRDKHQQQ
jgi:hypothetical protein